MQISFIYFSNPIGDRSIAEWVSLWKANELKSLYSAADIPQDQFGQIEKAGQNASKAAEMRQNAGAQPDLSSGSAKNHEK